MHARFARFLTIVLAAAIAVSVSDAAFARKKRHPTRETAPVVTTRDYDGTPIIMQGFRRTRPMQEQPARRSDRPVHIPRGSSTYIPRPVPSPGGGSPPAALLQPPPEPYKPPPINSFGDRVINCIHSFPLNAGVGNNPRDQQSYVRQCAN